MITLGLFSLAVLAGIVMGINSVERVHESKAKLKSSAETSEPTE